MTAVLRGSEWLRTNPINLNARTYVESLLGTDVREDRFVSK